MQIKSPSFTHLLALLSILASMIVRAEIAPESQYLLDAQRAYPNQDLDLLNTGELQFAVVKHMADTPSVKGVAVIVSDLSQSPDRSLLGLSQKLNAVGWITLIVAAPETQILDNFPNSELTEEQRQNVIQLINTGAFINQTTFDQVEQHLQQQMQSVMANAKQYPGFKLVVARGTAAAWLAKMYSEESLQRPDGLVALGPYWPQATLNNQVGNYLASSGTAVLDVFSQHDNNWIKSTNKERRIAAGKAFKVHYRQREIAGLATGARQQYAYVAGEIIGWVKSMGW